MENGNQIPISMAKIEFVVIVQRAGGENMIFVHYKATIGLSIGSSAISSTGSMSDDVGI